MKNWKAALVFLCIFISGAVAGVFVGLRIGCQRYVKDVEARKQEQPKPRRPIDDWSKRRYAEFLKRLNVTPDQLAKIEPLVQSAQIEFRKLREKSIQQTTEVMDRLDTEILNVLNDEQKMVFKRMIEERMKKFERAAAERAASRDHGPRAGGPPPPPPGGEPREGIPPPPEAKD